MVLVVRMGACLLGDILGVQVVVAGVAPQAEVVRDRLRSFQLRQGGASRHRPPGLLLLLRGEWARRPLLRRHPKTRFLDGLPLGCGTPAPLRLGCAQSCSFLFPFGDVLSGLGVSNGMQRAKRD